MATNPTAPKDVDFESLIGTPKPRAQRGSRSQPLTKASLKASLEFANVGMMMTGKGHLVLTPDEIANLSDAWYEVLKEYPRVAAGLARGRKLTVWGNALFVTYVIASKRVQATKNQPGTARANGRDDGIRENDADATRSISVP